ncbi:MFS transporter asaE [Psilocybe cubensis]|nr:MFS transporter asaE [Psilocybe cubensis]KAH9480098.1 MFS transporter asaE [Psilocybe cubensis]
MLAEEKDQGTPATICISLDEESTLGLHPSVVPTLVLEVSSENHPHASQPSLHAYTEGGLKANITVLGAFLALLCTFGQMNAFGTFQAWYAAHQLQHLPASTISWIGSLQLWVFFFSGAPIGRLFDAYGPTWLMVAGTLCYTLGMVSLSFCVQYYQYILSQGILLGLGVGLVFYPSLASISTHFLKYRATAIGIAIAGSSVGGVVYPIILQRLFESVGFGWGARISGLASGAGCVAATLMVSSFSAQRKPGPWFDIKVLSDASFILLSAGSCFVALGMFIPFFYIVDYAKHQSIPDHMSFYALAVMNAGGVLGRIAPAVLSDSIGRFNLLTPSAFLSGLSCVAFWLFAKSLVSIMLFSAAYGFFSGAFISLVTPCVAQISDIRVIGIRIGMLYTIISFP